MLLFDDAEDENKDDKNKETRGGYYSDDNRETQAIRSSYDLVQKNTRIESKGK